MRVAFATLLLLGLPFGAEAADPRPEPDVVIETLTVERVEVRPVRRVAAVRRGCTRCPGAGLPWGGLREPRVAEVPWGGLREPRVAEVPWGGLDGSCPPVRSSVRAAVVRVRG